MAETARKREVLFYQDANGKEPFVEWLEGLRDVKARRRILKRLRMVNTVEKLLSYFVRIAL